MGKVKAWKMDCEEKVYDMITEEMVNECDHVTELYKKIDAQLPDYFPGDVITSVCDETNEYWQQLTKKQRNLDIYRRVHENSTIK